MTPKQRICLLAIHDGIQATGVCPSYEELMVTLGLRSKSGIHRLISALAEQGFIRRLAHRARALEVVRLSPDAEALRPPEELFDAGRRQAERLRLVAERKFLKGVMGMTPLARDEAIKARIRTLGRVIGPHEQPAAPTQGATA